MNQSEKLKKFKTLQEIAKDLGISYSTLYRRLKDANIDVPRGLVSPYWQAKIKSILLAV